MKILIIEDNEIELEYCTNLIKEILSECSIFSAYNGEHALQLLNINYFDAVFIDVGLPGISGFDLANKIRSISRYHIVPIVFVTATDQDNYETKIKYNNYEYICKPYSEDYFKSKITPLLKGLKSVTDYHNEISQINIATKSQEFYINKHEILFAEIQKKKLTIHLIDGKIENVNMALIQFIDLVNDSHFTQCNKSYAVNVYRIASIVEISSRTWQAIFKVPGSPTCPISASYKKNIRKLMENSTV